MTWENSYSRTFVDLLSICAAAQVVVRTNTPGVFTITYDAGLASRAAGLLSQELRARLDTGPKNYHPSGAVIDDDCISSIGRVGPAIADRFCINTVGIAPDGYHGSSIEPGTGPISDYGTYQSILAQVIAAAGKLAMDVAAQATANTALDPTTGATCASNLATSRASYLSQLQSRYPGLGFV